MRPQTWLSTIARGLVPFLLTIVFTVTLPSSAAPQPRVGYIKVTSEPTDAAISIDGRASGRTPQILELPIGSHVVTVSKEFYREARITVLVERDIVKPVAITLERGPGWAEEAALGVTVARGVGDLTVLTDVVGATVTVDGVRALNTSPLSLRGVAAGRHTVTVHYTGASLTQNVLVLPGETAKVSFSLGAELRRRDLESKTYLQVRVVVDARVEVTDHRVAVLPFSTAAFELLRPEVTSHAPSFGNPYTDNAILLHEGDGLSYRRRGQSFDVADLPLRPDEQYLFYGSFQSWLPAERRFAWVNVLEVLTAELGSTTILQIPLDEQAVRDADRGPSHWLQRVSRVHR